MVYVSPETVAKFKKMFKEKYGVEYSDNEAREATHNLLGAFDWLLKQDMKQNPHLYKKTNSDEQGGVNCNQYERRYNTTKNKKRAKQSTY
jgi:hypothetical protein